MDVLHSDVRELWLVLQSRDCAPDPVGLSYDRARFIRTMHGGRCHQYLAASAYCFHWVVGKGKAGPAEAGPADVSGG